MTAPRARSGRRVEVPQRRAGVHRMQHVGLRVGPVEDDHAGLPVASCNEWWYATLAPFSTVVEAIIHT